MSFKTWNRINLIQNEENNTNKHDNHFDIDDAGMVDLLIQNRADVNNKGENGRTPLMMVAGQGESKSFSILLSQFSHEKYLFRAFQVYDAGENK